MLLERLRRAALLDSAVYREVAADTTAMTQATALVIVLALIYQTGILIQSLLAGGAAAETLGTFLLGIVGGIIIWIALAYVAHFLALLGHDPQSGYTGGPLRGGGPPCKWPWARSTAGPWKRS